MPGRMRSAQPAASPPNIEITIVASACSASARTFGVRGRLVARDDEQRRSTPPPRPSSSQQAAQASATPRPFGVSGGRRRRSPRGRRGRASPRASRRSRRRGRRGPTRRARRAPPRRRRVDRIVEDPGAVAPRRLDPEVDDRRALDDRHVAEHDDDVGVADRGERQPVGVERAGDLLRQHRLVRVEPDAQQLAERVRLLDRLRARRAP